MPTKRKRKVKVKESKFKDIGKDIYGDSATSTKVQPDGWICLNCGKIWHNEKEQQNCSCPKQEKSIIK